LTQNNFLLKNAPEVVKADFEKAEIPRFFTPCCIFKGPNWLHIFQCDGIHIASLEGFQNFDMEYRSSTKSNEDVGNARFTGVARLTSSAGKHVWVRPEDGFLYQK
jgi:hypothetical protein